MIDWIHGLHVTTGRSVDGSNSPVVIRCGRFGPQSSPGNTQGRGNGTGPTSGTATTGPGEDGTKLSPDETVKNKAGIACRP